MTTSDPQTPRTLADDKCPDCGEVLASQRGVQIHRALVHGIRGARIDDRFASVRHAVPLTETEGLLLDYIDDLEAATGAKPDLLDALMGPLAKADRWIVGHWTGEKDHACAECVPGGPIVEPGFRCVPHTAYARLAASKEER